MQVIRLGLRSDFTNNYVMLVHTQSPSHSHSQCQEEEMEGDPKEPQAGGSRGAWGHNPGTRIAPGCNLAQRGHCRVWDAQEPVSPSKPRKECREIS